MPAPSNQLNLYLLLFYSSTWYNCDFFLFHIEIEGKGGWIIGGLGGKGYVGPPLKLLGGSPHLDYSFFKAPVTPSRVSTALVRSCLILRSAVRSQENPDIFREKGPVTASWQRPRRCYGARMAFYRVLTEFLLAIICALTTLSLRFHGAHNACTALSRRSHCAGGVLKTFVCTTERNLRQFYVCSRK